MLSNSVYRINGTTYVEETFFDRTPQTINVSHFIHNTMLSVRCALRKRHVNDCVNMRFNGRRTERRAVPASVEVNGPLIEHYRKTRACLSRRDAAKKLKISEPALYFIERGRDGRHRTRPVTLRKIARLLKATPEELARVPVGVVGVVGSE